MSKDYGKVNIVVARNDGTTECVYQGSANTIEAMTLMKGWTERVIHDKALADHFIKIIDVRMLPFDMFKLNFGDVLDEHNNLIKNQIEGGRK